MLHKAAKAIILFERQHISQGGTLGTSLLCCVLLKRTLPHSLLNLSIWSWLDVFQLPCRCCGTISRSIGLHSSNKDLLQPYVYWQMRTLVQLLLEFAGLYGRAAEVPLQYDKQSKLSLELMSAALLINPITLPCWCRQYLLSLTAWLLLWIYTEYCFMNTIVLALRLEQQTFELEVTNPITLAEYDDTPAYWI